MRRLFLTLSVSAVLFVVGALIPDRVDVKPFTAPATQIAADFVRLG
jgi:hypothetical protein